MHNISDMFKNGLLHGKKGLVMGVANDKSIAWSIAQAAHACGAEIAFTYQGEALLKRIKPLAESVNSNLIIECDVTDQDAVDTAFNRIKEEWGGIDFLVHSIAFANKEELQGRYVDTKMENFLSSMNISCYSFTAVAKKAAQIMSEDGTMITMSYYGAEKALPNYNVMGVAKAALESSVKYIASDLGQDGIRVNAISAGPIKTLAAAGIGGFRDMLKVAKDISPLKRNTTTEDVAKTALYLLSDLSSGVTGEILHVDSGYNIVGMPVMKTSEG